MKIRTFKEIATGIVVEVNEVQYDRFFDNRNPSDWVLIGERND